MHMHLELIVYLSTKMEINCDDEVWTKRCSTRVKLLYQSIAKKCSQSECLVLGKVLCWIEIDNLLLIQFTPRHMRRTKSLACSQSKACLVLGKVLCWIEIDNLLLIEFTPHEAN
mgnify:CR=1 FL=1